MRLAVRRRISLSLLACLVGGFGAVQAATSPAGAIACADVIVARTMTVKFKPEAKSYAIGQSAKVDVIVTRPAPEDPLQLGVPIPTAVAVPAPDATVGVGLHIGPVFAPGYAKTNGAGKATISIKIPSYAKPGKVGIDAYAYRIIAQSPCYTFQEDGFAHKPGVFSVKA
jgi:hypothetical protein